MTKKLKRKTKRKAKKKSKPKIKKYIFYLYVRVLKNKAAICNLSLDRKSGQAYNEAHIIKYMMRDYFTAQEFIDSLQDK